MEQKELLKELNYKVEHLEIKNDYIEGLIIESKNKDSWKKKI